MISLCSRGDCQTLSIFYAPVKIVAQVFSFAFLNIFLYFIISRFTLGVTMTMASKEMGQLLSIGALS